MTKHCQLCSDGKDGSQVGCRLLPAHDVTPFNNNYYSPPPPPFSHPIRHFVTSLQQQQSGRARHSSDESQLMSVFYVPLRLLNIWFGNSFRVHQCRVYGGGGAKGPKSPPPSLAPSLAVIKNC